MKAITHDPFCPKARRFGGFSRECQRFAACAARWEHFFAEKAKTTQKRYEKIRRLELLKQAHENVKKARRPSKVRRPRKPRKAIIENVKWELLKAGMVPEMVEAFLAKAQN